jgi:DNA-binding protein HU-beta
LTENRTAADHQTGLVEPDSLEKTFRQTARGDCDLRAEYLAFSTSPPVTRPARSFFGRETVNKSQLIDALSARFDGNRKQAQQALEAVLDTITREVVKGEKVAITGFGSFEKRVREARWVRNPQTGARIKAKKTAVPKFTAGADFKNIVSGAKKLPRLTVAASTAAARRATTKKAAPAKAAAPAKKATATKAAPAKRTATKKAAPAKKTTTKKAAPAKKATTAKTSAAKKTTAKRTAPAKKTAAKKSAPAKKTAAKKTTTAKKTAKKS